MAFLLLLEALLQLLHDLFPAAECFDLRLLFVGQEFLGEGAQPVFGNIGDVAFAHLLKALEDMAENDVELVEVAFVLHQCGARQVIEILDLAVDHVRVHRLQQRQIFA